MVPSCTRVNKIVSSIHRSLGAEGAVPLVLLQVVIHPLYAVLLEQVYQHYRQQRARQKDKVERCEVLHYLYLSCHLLHV